MPEKEYLWVIEKIKLRQNYARILTKTDRDDRVTELAKKSTLAVDRLIIISESTFIFWALQERNWKFSLPKVRKLDVQKRIFDYRVISNNQSHKSKFSNVNIKVGKAKSIFFWFCLSSKLLFTGTDIYRNVAVTVEDFKHPDLQKKFWSL